MAKGQPLRLILASASLGRRQLLQQAGWSFEVMPSNVEEPTGEGVNDIRGFVQHVAWLKAAAVAPQDTESWDAVLIDADRKAANSVDKCEATETTKAFGLETAEDKYLKQDQAGHGKVRAALDGSATKAGVVKASVTGSINGETLFVDAVQIQN